MNAVSTFLSDRIIYIYFFYGLAFFSLGLALQVTARRQSAFRFAVAIMPLALFGYLHGAHEWLEMFMVMERRAGAVIPPAVDVVRLALLVTSFLALIAFSARLDAPAGCSTLRRYRAVWILAALWVGALIVIGVATQTAGSAWIDLGDVLARYILAVPGALLAARALMTQQRTFRAQNLFRFGRDLIWCAVVLVLYGAVSQLFVRPLDLPPASFLNSGTFLAWFGIPVQLFRTVLAILLTVYMVRVLRVFDVENRRRLDEAGAHAHRGAERCAGHGTAQLGGHRRVEPRAAGDDARTGVGGGTGQSTGHAHAAPRKAGRRARASWTASTPPTQGSFCLPTRRAAGCTSRRAPASLT
ncbi:MAG: hypothetical protein R2854_03515 [Caldilineaceae bacterium]